MFQNARHIVCARHRPSNAEHTPSSPGYANMHHLSMLFLDTCFSMPDPMTARVGPQWLYIWVGTWRKPGEPCENHDRRRAVPDFAEEGRLVVPWDGVEQSKAGEAPAQ
jgi:hypothetical protein